RRGAAMALGHRDGVALRALFAGAQKIQRVVGNGEVPAQRTRAAANAVLGDWTEREVTKITGAVRGDARAVRVGQIAIGEREGAVGGIQRGAAGGVAQLVDRGSLGR